MAELNPAARRGRCAFGSDHCLAHAGRGQPQLGDLSRQLSVTRVEEDDHVDDAVAVVHLPDLRPLEGSMNGVEDVSGLHAEARRLGRSQADHQFRHTGLRFDADLDGTRHTGQRRPHVLGRPV